MSGSYPPEAPEEVEILLQLHNLAAVKPEKAVEAREIANTLRIKFEDLLSKLVDLSKSGYVICQEDVTGAKRFHLTGLGIIKVSTLFS